MTWALAEAKNKFSEVVRLAVEEGPQEITRRGEKFILIYEPDFKKLTANKLDFKAFLLQKTPDLSGLDLTRDKSPMRSVKL